VLGFASPSREMTILTLIADTASIIGLVFSFLAFLKARNASEAANQAKKAILNSTYGEELALVCTSMDQLIDLLRHEHHLEAGIKAEDLVLKISELRFRRGSILADETKNNLLTAREQLHILAGEMRKPQVSQATQKASMKAATDTAVKLREELGKMKSGLDSEVQR
jgi:hypothetical protein